MAFHLSNLLFGAAVSNQAATNSAIGMIGSFIAAAALIVVPAAFVLIWVSQKDALQRGR
ncbi:MULTISPECIES: photosystem II reaction center X protein [unclassified Prochlorococcus]|uniref:photosystem II reaction center X protein n=1 Tax=unclassified Prochlorococcus TaxID=2627481 RepID=UPI000533AEA6|nr:MULTISPECIES: photosystem II reaction center X protein [unclassified Prochlorococcus]KGG16878.1 Photosystem II protein PsbX [Prochlorococcus sp. MIT 0602]KGG18148.1 Photosystem II protein PsbX [Prochlorococcus sp. MIT 0603]